MKFILALLIFFPIILFGQDKIKLKTGQEYDVVITNVTADRLFFVTSPSDSAINQRPVRIDVLKSIYIDNAVKYQQLVARNTRLTALTVEKPKNSNPKDPYLKRIEPKTQQQFEGLEDEGSSTDNDIPPYVYEAKPQTEKYGIFIIGFADAALSPRSTVMVDTGNLKTTGYDRNALLKGPKGGPLKFLSVAQALNYLNGLGWEVIQAWPEPPSGIIVQGHYTRFVMRKRMNR